MHTCIIPWWKFWWLGRRYFMRSVAREVNFQPRSAWSWSGLCQRRDTPTGGQAFTTLECVATYTYLSRGQKWESQLRKESVLQRYLGNIGISATNREDEKTLLMGIFQSESFWSGYLKILALVYIGDGYWQLVTGQMEREYDEVPEVNPDDDEDARVDKCIASKEYLVVDHFIDEGYSESFHRGDFSNAKRYCEDEGWASSPDFNLAWIQLLRVVCSADLSY